MKTIVILISGRGSNLQAILDARLAATVAAVISSEPAAAGLAIAAKHGIATRVVDHRAYAERAAFDAALAREIDAFAPDLVALAGFMRILTDGFVERYAGRLLNIHPSLLPAFTGLNTHRRALAAGVKIHGCTVHFVTPQLDLGPIVVQAAVPVLQDDSESTLAARVLAQEHRIYPQAIRWFCADRLEITPQGAVKIKSARNYTGSLLQPALDPMNRYLVAPALAALALACPAAQPASVTAAYDVFKDGLHVATVQETYENNGARYRIVSESNPAGLLALFVRTKVKVQSSGEVTAAGLRPGQFEYGRLDDASKNVSAEFDWNAALLHTTFDGRNDTLPLPAGTQDRLSIMYQFMFLPAESARELIFQMTNGKKIEPYRYRLAGNEQLVTPLGKFETLHFVKQRESGENGTEVWLAPEHKFFPVKLLILENDGSKFEQVITQLEFK